LKIFEANINHQVFDFFNNNLKNFTSLSLANQKMYNEFGISGFFDSYDDIETLKILFSEPCNVVEEPDRTEYGDFQTNEMLANEATLFLTSKSISPRIIVEPTCGKGNFIIAALHNFSKLEKIFGIEIYKPYVWEAKFNIVSYYLENPSINKPEIAIIHYNVFNFDFRQLSKYYSSEEILVIGNPPWVTNSKLGSINSDNLPNKTNFKNHSGIDAITGKGNFDIGEYITLKMIETFQKNNGHILLLIKNSVIKNIIFDQNKNKYKIASLEKFSIDSKKEFNVSVDASLFFCTLNSVPEFNCKEFNFYNKENSVQRFGWLNDKFVSNIDTYIHTEEIDGISPYIWRQGLKHDCSEVMELEKVNEHYINSLNEEVKLEDDLVYGLLKSSDLKNTVIKQTRKFTIVTQKKIGQETTYIKALSPKTYKYLLDHKKYFDKRKSSIYNGKPPFSIFGIGDYSFKLYKVAISGLYKTFHFTLVLPQYNKPVMLDDTCYFIGFDKIEFAVYSLIILNCEKTMKFLQSITFADAKRTFTKDVLMRINLIELSKNIDLNYLKLEMSRINKLYNLKITLDLWNGFIINLESINSNQISMFDSV
jgi:hypothetical protein